MNTRVKRARWAGVLGISAVVILLLVVGLLSTIAAKPAADTQPSDARAPLLAGGIAHSATVEVAKTYVTAWDYVNVHIKNVVTGSQWLTITPMFSNETGVACSGVTDWYTATDYQHLLGGTDPTSATLFERSKTYAFTINGNDQTARSIPVTGRCFMIKLTLEPDETYTPTYYLRLYNWDN